jgi:hypothetical protein
MTAFFTLDTIVCIYLRKEYGATTYQYLCHHAVAILGFYNSLKYQGMEERILSHKSSDNF